ncbi:MAG: hypothetical protein LBU87_06725 [Lactobacillales bacterium]|jgi:positive regulator of sigma E activity|nr:hypothetical protein [Lactobacillales bacterium]
MKKDEMKNVCKELVTLDKPVFVEMFEPKIKPYAKIIYYVFSVLLALGLLGSIATLFRGAFSAALISIIFILLDFVILRMFCEYLALPHKHSK